MRMFRRHAFFSLLFLAVAFYSDAQLSLRTKHFSGEDGIQPFSQCKTDTLGYTWFISIDRSVDRLMRYDGKEFTITDNKYGSHAVAFLGSAWRPNRDPVPLKTDALGQVWMGSSRGIFLMKNGQPEPIMNRQKGMPSDTVVCMEFDNEGVLWVLSYKGLGLIRGLPDDPKWESVPTGAGMDPSSYMKLIPGVQFSRDHVFDLEKGADGSMWWGRSSYLGADSSYWFHARSSRDLNTIEKIGLPLRFSIIKFLNSGFMLTSPEFKTGYYSYTDGFRLMPFRSLYPLGDDSNGNYYFMANARGGIQQVVHSQGKDLSRIQAPDFKVIHTFSEDSMGFFNSDVGDEVWVYDFSFRRFSLVLRNGIALNQWDEYPMLSLQSTFMFSPKPGVIWIQKMQKIHATLVLAEKGKRKISYPGKANGYSPLGCLPSGKGFYTTADHSKFSTIYHVSDTSWKKIGNALTLFSFMDEKGFQMVDTAAQRFAYLHLNGEYAEYQMAFQFIAGIPGGVFFVLNDDSLFRVGTDGKRLLKHFSKGEVKGVQADRSGGCYVWVRNHEIWRWSEKAKTFSPIPALPSGDITRFQDLGMSLLVVKGGTPFFLRELHRSFPDTLSCPDILTAKYFLEDQSGRIFFYGTKGSNTMDHIWLYHNDVFKKLRFNKDIPSEDVLIADNDSVSDAIVVTVNGNVYKYFAAGDCFMKIGTTSSDIGFMWKAITRDQTLYLGGWGPDILTFDLGQSTPSYPVLSFLRTPSVNQNSSSSRGTKISYGEPIAFRYRGIADFDQRSVWYQTRLIGWDTTWSEISQDENKEFSLLEPGSYIFQVRSMDDSLVWSTVLSFEFQVLSPWYRTWWAYGIFGFVVLGFIYLLIKLNGHRLQLANIALNKRIENATREIRGQKDIIEIKNKEITDSIQYARRIQQTLLASDSLLKKELPGHFVLFKPKDIVSGDFYWGVRSGDLFFLAVCDSTGHGVPGAFMSLLNISFMNEAINEKGMTEPGKILEYVRERLIGSISYEGGQDGMDGILLSFSPGNKEIRYAAANNPPVIVRNGTLQELDYDKMPVGKSELAHPFITHRIVPEQGDTLYLFTDGYSDQFGGPKGKKLKHGSFCKILTQISTGTPEEQFHQLEQKFLDWKSDLEQLDDVLVIGIRF